MAASSVANAADVSAAGAATVNCVGPLNTIMLQPPALLSRLAASSGGSTSENVIVLSHPLNNAAHDTTTIRTDACGDNRTVASRYRWNV